MAKSQSETVMCGIGIPRDPAATAVARAATAVKEKCGVVMVS